VIVVVEGPTAAGKTTWCRRHAGAGIVPEYLPTGTEPDGSDLQAQADYWVAVNSQRWAQARAVEAATGLAVCDSDPLKLHYSWCLSRIGVAPRAQWEHEYAAARTAFAAHRLGLADVVLLSIPPLEVLRQRRDGDPTRRRRQFDLHVRLGAPYASGTPPSTASTQAGSSGPCRPTACLSNSHRQESTDPRSTSSTHSSHPCHRVERQAEGVSSILQAAFLWPRIVGPCSYH
jgi:hypothetical protein